MIMRVFQYTIVLLFTQQATNPFLRNDIAWGLYFKLHLSLLYGARSHGHCVSSWHICVLYKKTDTDKRPEADNPARVLGAIGWYQYQGVNTVIETPCDNVQYHNK